jgi:site-specific DNA-methyltransferase (cytosine-N4-specific)
MTNRAGDASYLLLQCDARRLPLADGSVHCAVTSPPYFSQRDYQTGRWEGGQPDCPHVASNARPDHSMGEMTGTRGGQGSTAAAATPFRGRCGRCGAVRIDRQIGLEESPDEYVAAMVVAFREVWRVLRDDGTAWLNIGECFANDLKGPNGRGSSTLDGYQGWQYEAVQGDVRRPWRGNGLKKKDIIGIPWMLAFALRDDGWFLRDAIVWAKAEVSEDGDLEGSCMPGSQRDRCTFAHETVFLLSKSPRYSFDLHGCTTKSGAPLRNVWRVNTEPSKENHFAAMPRELARRCILLGTPERGCCPACMSPRRRLVEKAREATRPGRDSKLNGVDLNAMTGRTDDITGYRDARRHVTKYRTVGWEPTCRCGVPVVESVPCTVLDNFAGIATTGLVAVALGRRFVGSDLSREYAVMGRDRIDGSLRPASRLDPEPPRAPLAGQMSLIDLIDLIEARSPEVASS